ncbi:hypothetical protein J8F10_16645 [Gemmata sp. G18]|uniref:Uncharacterized protein n=1 Tax=Gemmata palustris TaxID=2822762 RepID=A0ABS5BT44_9BACT|nr:hypothetical protein [Gemmata palustris]MBP3956902.1 hypothetical protein [Gemmata palustris]
MLTDSEKFLDNSHGDYCALTKLGLSPDERTAARADTIKLLAAKQKKIELFSYWLAQWGVMDGYEAEKLFRGY